MFYFPLKDGILIIFKALCHSWAMTYSKLKLPVCRFIIGREKPGEQSEVAQLIQQTLEQERWQREMMEQRYSNYMGDEEEVRDHVFLMYKANERIRLM